MIEPEYMRLYREYAKAIRAFEIALKRRQRIRKQIGERRKAPPRPHRPVGVRPGAVLREVPATAPATPPPEPPPLRVDMGPILGIQEFKRTSVPVSDAPEPGLDIDTEALLDDVSRRQFWRARKDYEEARRAFFGHVRGASGRSLVLAGLEARRHLAAAKRHLAYGALDQWHGRDAEADDLVDAAKAEVLTFCDKIWKAYRRHQGLTHGEAPTSSVAQKVLVAAVAEAQLVNADDSGVVPEMQEEINRIVEEAGKEKGAETAAKIERDVDRMTDEIQRRIQGE